VFIGISESTSAICPLISRRRCWMPCALSILIRFALSSSVAVGQASTTTPAFDVASVKPSKQVVGPDYNNQLSYSPTGFKARNATLNRTRC
jgi:hypothetical protein